MTPLMLGEAVWPAYDTVALFALYSGATLATAVASPLMALTSASVNWRTFCCKPPREKPKFVNGDTVSRLEPSDWNWLTTCACVPSPTATRAITAPTPMTTPSMVRKERILCATSDCTETTQDHQILSHVCAPQRLLELEAGDWVPATGRGPAAHHTEAAEEVIVVGLLIWTTTWSPSLRPRTIWV